MAFSFLDQILDACVNLSLFYCLYILNCPDYALRFPTCQQGNIFREMLLQIGKEMVIRNDVILCQVSLVANRIYK